MVGYLDRTAQLPSLHSSAVLYAADKSLTSLTFVLPLVRFQSGITSEKITFQNLGITSFPKDVYTFKVI